MGAEGSIAMAWGDWGCLNIGAVATSAPLSDPLHFRHTEPGSAALPSLAKKGRRDLFSIHPQIASAGTSTNQSQRICRSASPPQRKGHASAAPFGCLP